MTVFFLPHPFFLAAAAGHEEQLAAIFFAQVLLLMTLGRLLGEWMQRIRQPAVIGQLLAGIILGPSVFGAIWAAGQQAIFPPNSSDRQMLNAVSEIGVLLLTAIDRHGDGFGACKARRPHRSHHFCRRNRHSFWLRLCAGTRTAA